MLGQLNLPRLVNRLSVLNKVDMKITSKSFPDKGMIPEKFTQEGEDLSPEIEISGVPVGTKSLVLICMDPDAPDPEAPQRTFIHWVIYNLPASALVLEEGADVPSLFPSSAYGLNDRDKLGYIGPKPPIGTHRYYFKAYAIDIRLTFATPPTAKDVLSAIDGRVIAMAEYMGKYKLKGN